MGSSNGWDIEGVALTQQEKIKKNNLPYVNLWTQVYSLPYSQLKSGSQFLGGEILQNFGLKNWIFSALRLSKKFLLVPMDFSDIIITETEFS